VPPEANGAFQSGSDVRGVRLIQIKDGLSNTILAGEKHVPLEKFGYGGWDCSMYDGANGYCAIRAGGIGFPIARSVNDPNWRWGSYHPGWCQFVLGDGSVRRIQVSIDEIILGYLCQINDGQSIPPYE
jgi:hypothetical protein